MSKILRFLAGLMAGAVLLASGPPALADTAAPVAAVTPAIHAERAAASYAALKRYFGADPRLAVYHERYPSEGGKGRYSTEWPFSQAHIAALDLTAMAGGTGDRYQSDLTAHRSAQMLYWVKQTRTGPGGFVSEVVRPGRPPAELFYDDNEWVSLAMVQHYLFTRDPHSLALAKAIFALIDAAWDDDPRHPSPGGLWWSQSESDGNRNTVSNMPAAELGVRLFLITGEQKYLSESLRFYRWTNATLQRPDGLYIDHLARDGTLDRRVFSYNQGVPVGVNVLLYQATKDAKYLAEAKRIAEASYRYYIDEHRIDGQPAPFNAIYFKNLLLLESVIGGHRYRDAMAAYADRMWTTRRDAKTGLYRVGHDHGGLPMIDQAAMVQIDAVLAWDPANFDKLY